MELFKAMQIWNKLTIYGQAFTDLYGAITT